MFFFQRGANKVPVFALVVITLISILFVFIGDVNTLGPIVTMPFMISYAAVDYAYFALAMSFNKQRDREKRFESGQISPVHSGKGGEYMSSTQSGEQTTSYGTMASKTKQSGDLDNLFPERQDMDPSRPRQNSLGSPTFVTCPDEDMTRSDKADAVSMASEADATAGLLGKPEGKNSNRNHKNVFCEDLERQLATRISMLKNAGMGMTLFPDLLFPSRWLLKRSLCN